MVVGLCISFLKIKINNKMLNIRIRKFIFLEIILIFEIKKKYV